MVFARYTIITFRTLLNCSACLLFLFYSTSALACEHVNANSITSSQNISSDAKNINNMHPSDTSKTEMNHYGGKGECCEDNCTCLFMSCSSIWAAVSEPLFSKQNYSDPKCMHLSVHYFISPQAPNLRPPIQL